MNYSLAVQWQRERGGGECLLYWYRVSEVEGDCNLREKILPSNWHKSCLQNTYKPPTTVRLTDWLPTDWMKLMKVIEHWLRHWLAALIDRLSDSPGGRRHRFVESFNEFCQLSGNGNNAPTFCNVFLLYKAVQVGVSVCVCVWKDLARGASKTFQLCVSLLKHFSFSPLLGVPHCLSH